MTLYASQKSFNRSGSNRGTAILSIVIVVAIGLLGFFYVIQANGVVGQGYEIRDIKENLNNLQLDNQNLQIETARLQFPANLEEIAKSFKMVESNEVTYLQQSAGVAIRNQTD